MSSGHSRARARFLVQAIRLEEWGYSKIISLSIYFSLFMIFTIIIWAWATEVNEVAATRGKVIPSGLIHNVQHLEGGIVSEVQVRNGDRVQKGALLLKFAPPAIQSKLDQIEVRKAALELQSERLQAIIDEREPAFGEIGQEYPSLAEKQLTIYKAQIKRQEGEFKVADARISQRENELKQKKNQAASIAREIRLLSDQVDIRKELNDRQVVARSELIAAQTKLAETESERRSIADGILIARNALEESKQQKQKLSARFIEQAEEEAGKVSAQIAEVDQTLIRLRDQANRLDLLAPVDGVVQGLESRGIGSVVEPGQTIMKIVPVEDELIVETRISPRDIGYIRVGQRADVKVDTYESTRFGSVRGTVEQLSASTYFDESGNPYYRAEITLDQDYLGVKDKQFVIIPGMTVQADIKTGSKTILDYLLRPISRGFNEAFTER